jgi:arsenate reductase
MEKKRVLILSGENSSCSGMAEGLLRQLGGDRFHVSSAGIDPTSVSPEAIEVMAEIGIDIRDHYPKSVDECAGQQFDWVITIYTATDDGFPIFPGADRYIHWSFENLAAPNGLDRKSAFRKVRDEIERRLKAFVAEHGSFSFAASGR